MRILLGSNASYFPPRGGSTRSNLVWLRHLATAGHTCRVLCAAPERGTSAERERSDQGISSTVEGNLSITPVEDLARKRGVLIQAIAEFKPDWILISSEDLAHSLLREAASVAVDRVIYLAHTPQFMPFGPESWNAEPKTANLLRNAAGVIVIGEHMASYVLEHLGVEAVVIHPPIYPRPTKSGQDDGGASFSLREALASHSSTERVTRQPCSTDSTAIADPDGYLLAINPCRVKGIEVFLALADRFPRLPFAAVPGWGTTTGDRRELERRPNIRLLPNVKRIEEVLAKARLLLMPSLWYEGFGLIVMEALLAGLPVISSDSGGLVEAKRGTGYIVPVKPITRYRPEFDDRHMPIPETAPQDLAPWLSAIESLLDGANWRAESERSLAAANLFVRKRRSGKFEEYLMSLRPAPSKLSPGQRALLIEKLRRRK